MAEIYDTLVIGAGQAGLAAGYYLQQHQRRFLLLESHARVGDSWRQRWEGLRLFSPQRYNALPGLPAPGEDWYLPTRLELADYLENYAAHFSLPVTLSCTCERAHKKEDGSWRLETSRGDYHARKLVVATGAYRTPSLPEALAVAFPDSVAQYHSSAIKRVEDLVEEQSDVLLVGAGASGQQLARLVLALGARTTLAGPAVSNLPRHFLGKDIYWWLYNSGMMTARTYRWPGKMLVAEGKGEVTVGEPPVPAGVQRITAKIEAYRDGRLHFASKQTAPLQWPAADRKGVIIWCTGYHNQYPWLPEEMLAADGRPRHSAGRSTVYPEVTFLGLPNQRHTNSSLVGGVGQDAGELLGG